MISGPSCQVFRAGTGKANKVARVMQGWAWQGSTCLDRHTHSNLITGSFLLWLCVVPVSGLLNSTLTQAYTHARSLLSTP